MGLPDVNLPGDIKFEEWDSWHSLIVTDEMSRVAYTGVLWGLGGGNEIRIPPLVKFGTEEQKAKFLPGVANGSIRFCLGITEPYAGSDVANIKTTPIRKDDHYVVNGSKKWITNAIWADYVTAAVRTGGACAAGISLLIIPLKAEGVLRRMMHNSGVDASGSTFITFDDVKVPVGNLLHKENRGFEVIMSNFNAERKSLATSAIRLSRVCAEDAWNHACTRETFGEKLIENPVIQAKFVKMGRMIEPAQAFLEQLTWLIELSRKGGENNNVRIGGMTAMLKVVSTRCLEKCVREAQQVMGGLGYARGGKGGRIEAISRDVRVMAVGGGSEEILSELAIKEEVKDLRRYLNTSPKL
ncbi:91aa603c-0c57-4ea8-a08d-1611daea57cf [Sclerotinia trifoliorum]|uniref:91aa603c-0c57-4ea8-a08d-1611daea57cf n=1 Tax=Sclerotinia trifoliorum TaxID=28548 RepID=A0A8H2ZNW3_9HELO|nr:91aa603c-0c57-4ea8-a08d-1611daea57cf [Sclerotinia trifoliorum]